MQSTTYVSVNLCGSYTYVQIKQLLNDGMGEESVKINPSGIVLNSSEFASLMYQLKAIENMFLRYNKQETESLCDIQSNKADDQQSTTGSIKPKRKLKDVKKETTTKKKKSETPTNESVMKVYAELLPIIIDGLIKSRCLGCMLNLDVTVVGSHNICFDRKMYTEQCFIEAMSLVDQVKVAELANSVIIPTLDELIVDVEWCNRLKLMLNSDNILL